MNVPGLSSDKRVYFCMKCKAAGMLSRDWKEASLAARPLLYIMADMSYRGVLHITICVFSAWPRRSAGTPGSVPEVKVLLEENEAPLAQRFLKFLFADEATLHLSV